MYLHRWSFGGRYAILYLWGRLHIAFANRELRDICEIQLHAERALGIVAATNLRARLADLREINSLRDLPAGRPIIHDVQPPGRATVELGEGHYLTVCANHVANPVMEDGRVDWQEVSRIKVVNIGKDQ